MKKEEIYLDLSKLSENERKEVLTTLLSNNEQVYHYDKDALENGKTYDNILTMLYFDSDNEWSALSVHDNRMNGLTEITLNQFKELFKPQHTIQLDKTKAYDLRDLNDEQFLIIQKEFQKQGGWDIMPYLYREKYIHVYFNGFRWYSDKNDREVINALTLFKPQLKIGDTFEHNGFICKVKSKIEVEKWYYLDGKYQKLDKYSFGATEITNQEFINELEKHAR